MYFLSDELGDGVYESNLNATIEQIFELQDRFRVFGHSTQDIKNAKNAVVSGFKIKWGSLRDYAYEFVEFPDKDYQKKWSSHRLKDGYNGRQVWIFFATPKSILYDEVESRDQSNLDTKRTLYVNDKLPSGSCSNDGPPHTIDTSRIIGFMDAYGQYYANPNFDADKLAEDYRDDGC